MPGRTPARFLCPICYNDEYVTRVHEYVDGYCCTACSVHFDDVTDFSLKCVCGTILQAIRTDRDLTQNRGPSTWKPLLQCPKCSKETT